MTQINDNLLCGRPGGARRPGAGRTVSRRTRVRVSSDAVVSAYIHDIARPARRRRATGGQRVDVAAAGSNADRSAAV
jgi:hypothetical protein